MVWRVLKKRAGNEIEMPLFADHLIQDAAVAPCLLAPVRIERNISRALDAASSVVIGLAVSHKIDKRHKL